jgi:hypothetical protein
MTMKFLTALCAIGVLAVTAPVAAQQDAQCADRGRVIMHLAENYGEGLTGYGLMGDGVNIIEVYTNAETGTWTIVYTSASGMSCLVADGEGWTTVKPRPQGIDG